MQASPVVQQLLVELDGRTEKLEAAYKVAQSKQDAFMKRTTEMGEAGGAMGERYARGARTAAGAVDRLVQGSEEGVKKLIESGGEMAFMFGPQGAIVGAIGIAALAVYHLFEKAREEAEKTRKAIAAEMEKIGNATTAVGASAVAAQIFSGDKGKRAAFTEEDYKSPDKVADALGIQGLREQIAKLKAIQSKPSDGSETVGEVAKRYRDATTALVGFEAKLAALEPVYDIAIAKTNELAKSEISANAATRTKTQADDDAKDALERKKKAMDDYVAAVSKTFTDAQGSIDKLHEAASNAGVSENVQKLMSALEGAALLNKPFDKILEDFVKLESVEAPKDMLAALKEGREIFDADYKEWKKKRDDEKAAAKERGDEARETAKKKSDEEEKAAQAMERAYTDTFNTIAQRGHATFTDIFSFGGRVAGIAKNPFGAIVSSILGSVADGILAAGKAIDAANAQWQADLKAFQKGLEDWRRTLVDYGGDAIAGARQRYAEELHKLNDLFDGKLNTGNMLFDRAMAEKYRKELEALDRTYQYAADHAQKLAHEQQRADIEMRLAEGRGEDDARALRYRRELEAATDDDNRALIEFAQRMEESAIQTERAARAQAEAQRVQDSYEGTLKRYYELLGDNDSLKQLDHQERLRAAMSDAEKELLAYIFAMEDAAAAAEKAADAQRRVRDQYATIQELDADILRSQGKNREADEKELESQFNAKRQSINDTGGDKKYVDAALAKLDEWFAAKLAEIATKYGAAVDGGSPSTAAGVPSSSGGNASVSSVGFTSVTSGQFDRQLDFTRRIERHTATLPNIDAMLRAMFQAGPPIGALPVFAGASSGGRFQQIVVQNHNQIHIVINLPGGVTVQSAPAIGAAAGQAAGQAFTRAMNTDAARQAIAAAIRDGDITAK